MSEEPKGCPFCGARTAYTAPPALGKGRWVVQCDDCRAEGPTSSDNSDAGEAEAIAAWNTRAPDDSAVVEVLREAREELLCKKDYIDDTANGFLVGHNGDNMVPLAQEDQRRIAALIATIDAISGGNHEAR